MLFLATVCAEIRRKIDYDFQWIHTNQSGNTIFQNSPVIASQLYQIHPQRLVVMQQINYELST